jgi:hypothetical protein
VILLDANLLIYAYDETSAHHGPAKRWVEDAFSESEVVAIPLVAVLAFLRVMSNPALFEAPMSVGEAVEIVDEWLSRSNVGIAQPTRRHWEVLAELARTGQARGPLLMDAHVAALALEHGATLCTSDRDFTRFPGLSVEDPLRD